MRPRERHGIKKIKEVASKAQTTAAMTSVEQRRASLLAGGAERGRGARGTCHKLRTRGTPSTLPLYIPWLRNAQARVPEKTQGARAHARTNFVFAVRRRCRRVARHFYSAIDCVSKEGGERASNSNGEKKEEGEKPNSSTRGYAAPHPRELRPVRGKGTSAKRDGLRSITAVWRRERDGGRRAEDADKETKKGERCSPGEKGGRRGKRAGEDRSLFAGERSGSKEKRHRRTATCLSRARIFQYRRWSATADAATERGNACDDVRLVCIHVNVYMYFPLCPPHPRARPMLAHTRCIRLYTPVGVKARERKKEREGDGTETGGGTVAFCYSGFTARGERKGSRRGARARQAGSPF